MACLEKEKKKLWSPGVQDTRANGSIKKEAMTEAMTNLVMTLMSSRKAQTQQQTMILVTLTRALESLQRRPLRRM